MADAVTSQTLTDGDRTAVMKFTNISDGNGEASVVKVDVSAMAKDENGASCLHLVLQRVWFSSDTGDGGDTYVRMDEEDSNGDIPVLGLTGSGYWDFREFGGIKTDKSANSNQSDVNLVVPAAADSGNMYTVIAEFKKLY